MPDRVWINHYSSIRDSMSAYIYAGNVTGVTGKTNRINGLVIIADET